jgi:hypothetical protein
VRLSVLKWFLLGFAAFFAQTHFSVFDIPLNVTSVLVYAFGLRALSSRSETFFWSSPELKSTVMGALIGFVGDTLSGSIVGPEVFSKGAVGFLTPIMFTDVLFRWTPLLGALVLCFLSILDGAVSLALRFLFTDITVSHASFLQTIVVQGLMNTAFGVILKPAGETA